MILPTDCHCCLEPPCCVFSMQVRELIYREILEYHPHMLADFLAGNRQQPSFLYPSAVDNFKRSFAHLEGGQLPPGAGGECLCRAGLAPAASVASGKAGAGAHFPAGLSHKTCSELQLGLL